MTSILKPDHSLLLRHIPREEAANVQGLLDAEARWHYSQHFLAEQRGEEVLADISRLASGRKARMILEAQLKDEQRHVSLFSRALSNHGVDVRASRYADGYVTLVKEQETLSEKVFVFQILTEAVSAAYCTWRIGAMIDDELRSIDQAVLDDELRHLDMGRSLLAISDVDERRDVLSVTRRRQLLRRMSELCQSLEGNMRQALLPLDMVQPPKTLPSSLDAVVSRFMLRESRNIHPRHGEST